MGDIRQVLRISSITALGLLLLRDVTARAETWPAGFVVIVNPKNPHRELDRDFITRAFFKKVTRWPDGSVIRPVDQRPDSPVRRRFTEYCLGRSPAAVRNAWQQAIFAGRDLPPPELDSDAAVVAFVMRNPGAIGYVSSTADIDGAGVVTVR